MNYLKKGFKFIYDYFHILLLIVPFIVIILISCNKSEEKLIIVTSNESYILLNDELDLNVDFFIEDKYSFYIDKENIKCAYLTNKDETEKYSLDINEIIKTNSLLKRESLQLTNYRLNFKFNYNINELRIPEGYILLEYSNNEAHKIKIGSFIYYNSKSNDLINIHNMKGIVNSIIPGENINNLSTVGIILNISSNSDILINGIELLHGNGRINQDQIIKLERLDYDNSVDINTLLNVSYRKNYIPSQLKNIISLSNQNNILLLPVSYNTLDIINKAGIIIKYIYNGEEYVQLIKPIPIFNSTSVNNYNVYEYDPTK